MRQEPAIDRLARRIEALPFFDGAFLLGSHATGTADDVSDVDLIVVAADGRWEEAWAARELLHGDDVLACFDDVDPEIREIGAHKWLSSDVVFFDCLLATPSSGARIAEPFRVLVGEPDLPRRAPFERADLETFAEERRAAGREGEIETAYHALKRAVRQAR